MFFNSMKLKMKIEKEFDVKFLAVTAGRIAAGWCCRKRRQ